MSKRYLLDVNVLAALTSDDHEHYGKAHQWFDSLTGDEWAICPLTEAGYMRLASNPATGIGRGNLMQATEVLAEISTLAGYRYWPIAHTWAELTAPFASRISGHQQVTDAYLLGLAIQQDGVLVTFDRGIRYVAGAQFQHHVLVLE